MSMGKLERIHSFLGHDNHSAKKSPHHKQALSAHSTLYQRRFDGINNLCEEPVSSTDPFCALDTLYW